MNKTGIYDPVICDELVDFFDIEPYREQIISRMDGSYDVIRTANPLPLFSKFAADNYITLGAMMDWIAQYPAFSLAYERAKSYQEYILVTNALLGLYNSKTATFAMKNLIGWQEKIETVHSGQIQLNSVMNKIADSNKGKDLIQQRDEALLSEVTVGTHAER
jgi:hypothetical protein